MRKLTIEREYRNCVLDMKWIDNSRIAAIFAVVVLHVSANEVLTGQIGNGEW